MPNCVLYSAQLSVAWPAHRIPPATPKETDARRLRELLDVFSDKKASNNPRVTWTAWTGGHRPDEGLENLLPADWPRFQKLTALKESIATFLRGGGSPDVERSSGDQGMQLDAATYHHFRVVVADVRLFVKVFLEERDVFCTVISVKRDDSAWK